LKPEKVTRVVGKFSVGTNNTASLTSRELQWRIQLKCNGSQLLNSDPAIKDGFGNLPIHYASEVSTAEDFRTLLQLLQGRYEIIAMPLVQVSHAPLNFACCSYPSS
jgi:hypothetical protein